MRVDQKEPKDKVSINSRLTAIQIQGQRKAFCKKLISEPNCERKETVDKAIFITSKQVNRKIKQPTSITNGPPTKIRKWNQFSQFRASSSPDMPKVFHARPYGRFIDTKSKLRSKQLRRTNHGFHFLGLSFSNRHNVRAPIQFGTESQQCFLISAFQF